MKNYLERLQLRWKLALMLCVPILALIWFVQGELRRAIPASRQAQPMIDLIDLAGRTSTLMHYLQQERGASSGYLISSGQMFNETLESMRNATDTAEAELKVFLADFTTDAYGKKFSNSLNHAVNKLHQLPEYRSNISSLKVPQSEVVAFYSELNKAFLELIHQMPKLSSNARLTMNAAAFSSFILAKSLAGRERMEMSSMLFVGELNQNDVTLIAGLINQQSTSFDTFQTLATTEMKALHEHAKTTDGFTQVKQLREAALGSVGRKIGLTPVLMELGYGGMIHTFKNYILRGSNKYVGQFEKKHQQISQLLNTYRQMPGLSQAQLDDVLTIQNTADQYKRGVETTTRMITKLASIKAIDQAIKIDDGPALAAIDRLQSDIGVDLELWFDTTTARIDQLKQVEDKLVTQLMDLAKSIESQATTQLLSVITIAAIALAAAALFAIVLARIILCQLGGDPKQLLEVVEGVAGGDLHMDLSTKQPATGIFAAMQTMQANLRERAEKDRVQSAKDRERAEKDRERTERDRVTLEDSTRLKSALDAVKTNVMMADEKGIIIYCNDTLMEMLGNAENDIRNDLPHFDINTLVGSNFDIFHKNPAHQRAMVESLTSVHTVEITVSRHNFRFVATPVFGADDQRLGTVVEWSDRTQELATERDVQMMVDSVLQGDLSRRVDTHNMTGFAAIISNGVNGIVDKLSSAMHEIRESTDIVHAVASDIAQGNGDISERTEKQASSLEETSASMGQMTGAIRKNAEDAASASKLAASTRDIAEQGGEVVSHAIAAMEEIDQSSRQIAAIIGVINDISFQTNLLALNASVEAARAGEQGRGFAVIASEVRNLASACAEAAKEIEDQIKNSVEAVEKGNRLVNESGETLSKIVSSVRQVTDIVAMIAQESEQQSRGVNEINMAIANMDGMTQQNAELVEDVAMASQNMRAQADVLNEVVSNYKVGAVLGGDQRNAA
ncbi:MAG: methyl-accepting chemotaxis protein [Granulosicoccus sp.]